MKKKNYQFTQVPTNLFILLDNNCRSMLFTLVQLSSYYADKDGWFFRTYEDLEMESNLSKNLVEATIQTLFNHHIIEAKPTGYGKGKKPNYYKVNFDNFAKYDEISIEDAMKNPDFKINTVKYKGSNFKLNLVRETVKETVTKVVKSDNNIDNIDNAYNSKNVNNNNIINENKQFEIECKHVIKKVKTVKKKKLEHIEKVETKQSKSSTVEDGDCEQEKTLKEKDLGKPTTLKELQDLFKLKIKETLKDVKIEELQDCKDKLFQELEKYNYIPYFNNLKWMIANAIEKKEEKLQESLIFSSF